MEENKNRKRNTVDFSVVLSFVVAFFAMFSLAAFGVMTNQGMNILSYAAGDTFDLHLAARESDGKMIYVRNIASATNDSVISIPMHCADEDCAEFVYCYDKENENIAEDIKYTKNTIITQKLGLIYLVNKMEAEEAVDDNEYADHWVKQIAVWEYLGQLSSDELSLVKDTRQLTVYVQGGTDPLEDATTITVGDIYTNYIQKMLAAAKNFESNYLKINADDPIGVKLVENDKYYETDKIVIAGDDSLASYKVSLSNIEGAFVVIKDENGKMQKTEEAIPKGKEFYVRVPVDKVKEETKKLRISVTATYDLQAVAVYNGKVEGEDEEPQALIALLDDDVSFSKSLDIEFTGAPSTGMSVGQTIYFVGLIVLLCGVGIIYANAKPIEKEQ